MMTSNDAGMGMTVGSVIGLVVAGLLGLVFLVSCVASVVKAVRDRREIKARIAAKRAGQINGHAPGADDAGPEEGRRGRPNILIIHDGEREERVKKGAHMSTSASSPRFPSGVSSPWEQTSHHTQSTTVAEMACPHSSLTTSPGDDGSEGAEGGVDTVRNGQCSLPGQVSDVEDYDGEGKTRVDISGEVIKYRRSPVSYGDPNDIVPAFPGCSSEEDETTKQSGSEQVQGGPRGKGHAHRNCSQNSLKYVVDDTIVCEESETVMAPSTKDKSSPTFHGYAKNKAPAHRTAQGTEHVRAVYSPRRNSYAAAIASDPDWLDQAIVRRHSDEARHPITTTSRPRKDNTRMRGQCRNGADNPAYNAADDRIEI